MYDDHYGLSGRPFQLTPDPRFWFDTATHARRWPISAMAWRRARASSSSPAISARACPKRSARRRGRGRSTVLRGRGGAPGGRGGALRAARHRGRDHPRAGRRGRPDHALELSARDPGLEDRAGARVRQLRRVQAGRAGAGLRLGAGRHPGPRGRAGGRVQPGHGHRRDGRRRAGRTRPTWTRSASPARSRSAGCWPGKPRRAWPSCSSRWAARTRWWCSTTPTSTWP